MQHFHQEAYSTGRHQPADNRKSLVHSDAAARGKIGVLAGSPKIDFIFFDAGGGHRAAASALKAVIEQQQRPWEVRLVNLQEVLDTLDIFRKITSLRLEDVYNLLLKKGWTLGSPQLIAAMHLVIRIYHRGQVKLLKKFWAQSRPDLLVSLVPNFNRALYQSLEDRTPMVTILTDFADYPPHSGSKKTSGSSSSAAATARLSRRANWACRWSSLFDK